MTRISLLLSIGAAFVAAKDGDGPWIAIEESADGRYRADVGPRFGVARVCDDGSDVWMVAILDGDGSPSDYKLGCPAETATVTVTSVDSTPVYVDCGRAAGSGTSFSIEVPLGTWDLVATDSERYATRIARQVVTITGDTSVEIVCEPGTMAPAWRSSGLDPRRCCCRARS